MTSLTQSRGHASHSHHHHHHDNTYLVSSNKNDAGVKITRVGLYVNLGMAVGKGIGGYMFNSQALVADALHSLTDLISDVLTLATVSWSLKPPTVAFPGGYGKVESLGSLGVSGILVGGGLMMGWAAVISICQQFFPDFAELAAQYGMMGHSHHHDHSDFGPNINAIWLAAGSIVIKEWLYRATLKIAKERNSGVLAANAYHHRVDSLTAFVALLMIAGSNMLSNAAWLDPVGGLVISLMVIQAGWGNFRTALFELADAGVEEEMTGNVREAATQAAKEVKAGKSKVELRNVQGVKSGQNYLMDIEVAVAKTLTLNDTRAIEDEMREKIGAKVRGVKRVRVRFVPLEAEIGVFDEFVNLGPQEELEPESSHDHANGHSHSHDSPQQNGSAKNNGVTKRR